MHTPHLVTKAAGDYGADLIIQKDGKKTVIQAKRYSNNVGIKAVGKRRHQLLIIVIEAWVVSNSDYTVAAYELAKSNRVKLINHEGLIEMILDMNSVTAPTPTEVIVEIPMDEITCPKCGNKLVEEELF